MLDRKNSIRVGVGALISVAALAVLVWYIELEEVLQALRQLDYRYFPPMLILMVVSFWTRAAGWRTILPEKVTLWKTFLIINAGYFLNTLFPFRMGEVGRAFLLKPSGLDFWEAIPTIVLERIFDLILAVSLFLGALPFIFDYPQGTRYTALLGGLVIIGLCILFLVVRFQSSILTWIGEREWLGEGLKEGFLVRLRALLAGLEILSDPVRFLRAFLWMVLTWGLALGYQYLLLRAFTNQAELLWAAFGLGAVALGVSLPSSPGNIGIYEASLVAALMILGVDRSLAFAYAIVSHVLNVGFTTLFGSYALVHEGFELRKMWDYGVANKKEGEV